MIVVRSNVFSRSFALQTSLLVAVGLTGIALSPVASAHERGTYFRPGNLLISREVYGNNPKTLVSGVTQLPPGCAPADCTTATASGAYPEVWNNDLADGNFGVAARIVLDQLTPSGRYVNSLPVGGERRWHEPWRRPHSSIVGSFSSKSEGALNLSVDGRAVSMMAYLAPADGLDISNSNTPGVVDPTNPDTQQFYRVAVTVDQHGRFNFTKTNAFSGDNGRAVILNDKDGADVLYGAGNGGNGAKPEPDGIIASTGAQLIHLAHRPLAEQDPGMATPVGSFNIAQIGGDIAKDHIGKDTNFRGLTVFNNVVYFTKGSGGQGVLSVYFVDTSGYDSQGRPLACPDGIGLPNPDAKLPTSPIVYDASALQTKGVYPYNMCILKGLPTLKKKKTDMRPFGIWFANAKTFYLADEGSGDNDYDATSGTYTSAAGQATAGLQKWVFDDSTGAWKLAYTLSAGLDLGKPYTVAHYPTGNNAATGLPWAPATDGLRNITGRVNRDGTASIWAITSTVSGSGDEGADPNKLVKVTDHLSATSLPAGESFATVRTARSGEVLRGVSFTPGTRFGRGDHEMAEAWPHRR